ncbi:peptide MFS transporter [Sphingomonas sp. 28-63-12]|uniref:peptide MFS transporter n=1 Tax=Sphingomonas sp. 28-63-12 TaxID=1970434 RepID=UPI000BCFC5A2|nr:MAG: MFS transporter [Sphingomonas sp. 28-63-12]
MFDHPRGLWVLAGTELWERISFHGMQALLVLYMVGALLLPGHVERIAGFATFRGSIEGITGPLSVQALAAQIFGLYVGLIYFTPVIGGAIGDRLIGRRVAVVAGGSLMAAGHFCLAFDRTFLLALLLLILGAGLLRGNLGPQVKSLYADGDRREADAFQLYYVAINIGAFIAPLITGTLAVVYGWHFGFGFAGVGMLIGLTVYLAGQHLLPPERQFVAAAAKAKPLDRLEQRRLAALFLVFPLIICFWIAQSQVWNVYNLWARDHVEMHVLGFVMPVPWLQAFDGLAPVIVMPLFLALWRWQAARGHEPDDLAKMATGCLIFAGATGWLALAPLIAIAGKVPLLWAIAFHLLSNIGWLYFTPIALALFASKSPARLRGTMIGVNYMAVFFASTISGRLGGLYETLNPSAFWLLHGTIVGGAGIGLILVGKPLRGWFADQPDPLPASSSAD